MSPHRRPVPVWYALLAVLVSVLAVSGGGIWYTSHAQREADQRWCELLTILASGPAPTTEQGRVIADAMAQLRQDFGCQQQ